MLVSIVGPLSIAETMYENALNFGTVRCDSRGRIVMGDDIPLGLVVRRE